MDIFEALQVASADIHRQRLQGASFRVTYVAYDDGVLCYAQENNHSALAKAPTNELAGRLARQYLEDTEAQPCST